YCVIAPPYPFYSSIVLIRNDGRMTQLSRHPDRFFLPHSFFAILQASCFWFATSDIAWLVLLLADRRVKPLHKSVYVLAVFFRNIWPTILEQSVKYLSYRQFCLLLSTGFLS